MDRKRDNKNITTTTPNFILKACRDVIWKVYPKMATADLMLIGANLYDIFIEIKKEFVIDENILLKQLQQNENKDFIGLVNILLPYVDDKFKPMIVQINDIYMNDEYSTIQNQRCFREELSSGRLIMKKKREFNEQYLECNKILLMNTIQTISHKLYVNWIDVLPVTMYDYHKTAIYQKYSTEGLDRASFVYDTIVKELYHRIKNIKWLLYVSNSRDSKIYTYVNILGKIFITIDRMYKTDWDELDTSTQMIIEKKWKIFLDSAKNSSNYDDIDGINVRKICVNIIKFFKKYYTDIEILKKNNTFIDYEYEGQKNKNVISKEPLQKINIDEKKILNSVNITPVKDIYKYVQNCMWRLSKTWYGLYLFNDNSSKTENGDNFYFGIRNSIDNKRGTFKIKLKIENESGSGSSKLENPTFTFKNIYSYAEFLCRIDKQILSPQWDYLNDEHKRIIINRLDPDTDISKPFEWFRIDQYIRNTLRVNNYGEIKNIKNSIVRMLNFLSVDISLQCAIKKGSLTEFNPAPILTDKKNYPDQVIKDSNLRDKIKKYNLTKEKQTKYGKFAYYYPTEEPYEKMDTIRTKESKIPLTYFETLTTNQTWYNNYAMNWISQINFFHHYLNNRVTYVTGSTGVGKSTQIPKLYYYALKVIDGNYKGKILCTEPRRKPTRNAASRISYEMGLPIEQYSKHFDRYIDSDLYYLQYKYKGTDAHIQKPSDDERINNYIKVVTDGTFLEEIIDNPLLKKKLNSNEYSVDNLYDVIIVDEAHEHNMNMDLILTLSKYAVYYNNSLRLVIISATMGDDEGIYARYYRDVNDNLLYPLGAHLGKYELDRINVGRRLHISPAGETTKYKITEKIIPVLDLSEPNDIDTKAMINVVVESVEKLFQKRNPNGDILIFYAGSNEIRKTCELLNISSKIPKSTIAIPLYSEMIDDNQRVVTEICENYNLLSEYPKSKLVEILTGKNSVYTKKTLPKSNISNHKYNQSIIISTNIAEASLTIPSIKIIIDTGMSKIEEYNYKSRSTQLHLTSISESNRIQRKGRLGRVSDGTIFYLYDINSKKKSIANTKNEKYEITRKNMAFQFFRLITAKINDQPLISFDPSILMINDDINSYPEKQIEDSKIDEYIKTMIKKQYYLNGKYITYYGDPTHYDYDYVRAPAKRLKTGYSYQSVADTDFNFYIIHPEEYRFKRDGLGNVVQFLSLKSNAYKIVDPRDKHFTPPDMLIYLAFKEMMELNFVYYVFIDDTDENSTGMLKSEYGIEMWNLYRRFMDISVESSTNISIRDLITYVYSRKYKCSDEIVKIITMLSLKRTKRITDFVQSDSKISKQQQIFSNAFNLFRNNMSDFVSLLKMFSKFESIIERIEYDIELLSKTVKVENDVPALKNKILSIKDKYEPLIFKTYEEYKYVNNEINKYYMNQSQHNQNKSNIINDIHFLKKEEIKTILKKYENIIMNTAKLYYLNDKVFLQLIQAYILKFRNKFMEIEESDLIKNFDDLKINKEASSMENIIKSFMHGYAGNYFFATSSSVTPQKYKSSTIGLLSMNIEILTMPFSKNNQKETFLDSLGSNLLYIESIPAQLIKNPISNTKSATIISNIKPEWINETSFFYNYKPRVINGDYMPNLTKLNVPYKYPQPRDSNLEIAKQDRSILYQNEIRNKVNIVGGNANKTEPNIKYKFRIARGNNICLIGIYKKNFYIKPILYTDIHEFKKFIKYVYNTLNNI